MTIAFAASDFLQAFQCNPRISLTVREIFRTELSKVCEQAAKDGTTSSMCPLDNLGEFFTSALNLLALLAEILVKEDRIAKYIEEQLMHQQMHDELSDLSIVSYFDSKFQCLQYDSFPNRIHPQNRSERASGN